MSTIVTDADQIKTLIQEAVAEALENEFPTLLRQATQKQWLTKQELKNLTGWSDRTIQHLRDSLQIPFSQHGRKILYPTEGIESFLRVHQVQPREPNLND